MKVRSTTTSTPSSSSRGETILLTAIAGFLAVAALGFVYVRGDGNNGTGPAPALLEKAPAVDTVALGQKLRQLVKTGVPPETVVLHGSIDVHDAPPDGRWAPVDRENAGVSLFRGLLSKSECTRRWSNDSHVVGALRRGCYEAATWPLSTSNQLCMAPDTAPAMVARSRRRMAFWPGDEEYRPS